MLSFDMKNKLNTLRDILVGKVPDPKSQVEQITIAMVFKFMDDMDKEFIEDEFFGGERKFFVDTEKVKYSKYAWSNIMNPQVSGQERADLYRDGIEAMQRNPNLPDFFRDVFRNAYIPFRDAETINLFLKEINDFTYNSQNSEDLGEAFEMLLSIMSSQGDAGQFRTPRHIIDMIVEIVQPTKSDRILDPACGTAGFLISAYKYILNHNLDNDGHIILTPDEKKKMMQSFEGYDISQDMVRLSRVNMYLHHFSKPRIFEYDTLTSLDRWDEQFDVILANPPFMTPKGGINPHNRFRVQAKRSEILFVDYIAEHLSPNGRAGIIVPEGVVFQSANAYKELRKYLVDEGLLYAVISLPAGIFNPYSGVKTSVLLIDKAIAKQKNDVLFVKMNSDGFDLGAQRRENKQNDIPCIIDIVKAYQNNEDVSDNALVQLSDKQKIAEQDYILVGERYKETAMLNSAWPIVRLGDVCNTSSGGTPKSNVEEYYKNGTINWLKSGEVSLGFIYETDEKITEEALSNSSAKIFPKDTVVIAMYGATVGQVGILKVPSSTNQAVCAVLPNGNFIPEFLYYLLKAKRDFLIGLSTGGAQPNISQTIIKNLSLPMPPLSVQKEIVAEIENYQKIIDGAKQIIDNYKPTIKIDPTWDMVKLGDIEVFDVESGGTPSSDTEKYWNGGVKWATLADLPAQNYITEINSTERTISKLGLQKSSAKLLPPNTILVSTRATIGRIAIAKVPLATNQGFKNVIIRCPEKVNEMFAALMLSKLKSQMMTLASGGTFKEISKTSFCSLSIPIPPIEIQNQIVDEINEEMNIIKQNKRLIEIIEHKITDKISEVWSANETKTKVIPFQAQEPELKYAARNCTDKFVDAVTRQEDGDSDE